MDFNHSTVFEKADDYRKRLFLEVLHSQRDQNAENEQIDIPDIYKSLYNIVGSSLHYAQM